MKYLRFGLITFVMVTFLLVAFFSTQLSFPFFQAHSDSSSYYTENAVKDTGAVNIVSSILFDYRGFDTLGEAIVLFCVAAAISVIFSEHIKARFDEGLSPIAKASIILYSPCMIVYGLYIILHGHISPGGGFQGGVVLAALILVFLMAFGVNPTIRYIDYKKLVLVETVAMLGFILIAAIPLFFGDEFFSNLGSVFFAGTPGDIFSAGNISFLNIAVGIKVAASIGIMLLSMVKEGEI